MERQTSIAKMQRQERGIIQEIINSDVDTYKTYKWIATLIDSNLTWYYGSRILFDSIADTKIAISMYLLSNNYKWDTLIASTQFDYNPIDNYDGEETETITTEHSGDDTRTIDSTIGQRVDDVTDTNTNTGTIKNDGTTTTGVAPYNQSSFANTQQVSNNDTTTNALTIKDVIQSTTGSQNNNSIDKNEYNSTVKVTRESSRHGNMGVTSTQSMILQEREIANINIAKDIAHEIANMISYNVYDYYVQTTEVDYDSYFLC